MRSWPFRSSTSSRAAAQVQVLSGSPRLPPEGRHAHPSLAAYPPCDPGLPVQNPDTLVSDQQELLAMLRLHAALPPDKFETRFAQPLARVAAYVNVLPGSASDGFAGAGGLFRAAAETAFTCFRASDGRIFTGALGVEARHRLERRWRYLCFASGLLYPLGGALGSMAVMDAQGTCWSPALGAVTSFAPPDGAGRLFVSWLSDGPQLAPAPLTGSFALGLIGQENIEWLELGSPGLLRALLDIVTGAPPKGLIAEQLVRDVWRAVLARENARRHQSDGRLTIGSNVTPYLLDAMVGLARTDWRLDADTLHADAAGLYLDWPKAGRDIIAFCRTKGYPGIPATETALLFMLISTRLVEAGGDGVSLVPFVDRHGEQRLGVMVCQPGLLVERDWSQRSAGTIPATFRPVRPGTAAPEPDHGGGRGNPASIHRAKPGAGRVNQPKVPVVPSQGELPLATAPSPHLVQQDDGGRAGNDNAATMKDKPSVDEDAGEGTSSTLETPAGLLPDDLRSALSQQNGELLDQLIELWRSRGTGRNAMQRCEQGAAFEFALLNKLTADPTSFLTRLGELGLLYVSPNTTGKMIYPVTLADGRREAVPCFILAPHAMRRLDLQ